MTSTQRKLATAVGLLLLFAGSLATNALAASGGVVTLPGATPPGAPAPKTAGLSLTIDTTWVPSCGYRPVRIKVTPTAPVTADRTLQIRFTPLSALGYGMLSNEIAVTRELDIPAGSTGEAVTISVPQHDALGRLSVGVFEDGKRIDGLSADDVMLNGDLTDSSRPANTAVFSPAGIPVNSYSNWGQQLAVGHAPTILLLGIPVAETRSNAAFVSALQVEENLRLYAELQEDGPPKAAVFPATETDRRLHSVGELPAAWVDYTGIDVVVLPLAKLNDVVLHHPDQWRAIRSTIAAGGNLWVYDVGLQWERLNELESLIDLDIRNPPLAGGQHDDSPAERGWTHPDPKSFDANAEGDAANPSARPDSDDVSPADAGVTGNLLANVSANMAAKHNNVMAAKVFVHSLGRGQVIAISEDGAIGDSDFDWRFVFQVSNQRRWQWVTRHGLILTTGDLEGNESDFWEFLIPGVGMTPVLLFQILISLFVVLIGPVNYLLLRRWQRLNLLLITVPASAALVTLSLFGYALFHDGLGVRARVRSFTELDQRRGEAVCWSRLSYYAGISPSRGLTFPGDMAIYPLRLPDEYSERARNNSFRPDRRPPREIEWIVPESGSADGLPAQHLSRDWLPARVPTQFIAVRSRKSSARLKVVPAANGQPPRVENQLGVAIKALWLTDAEGNYFVAGELPAGESAQLAASTKNDTTSALLRVLSDNALQAPPGSERLWMQTVSSRNGNVNLSNSSGWMQKGAVLERSLHDASEGLAPRRFVAIVEHSPEVELGTDAAREEGSFHMVVGNW